ncbi:glyoxylase-like metal-dependent hydrolase (beta-lactamase superfamily II) [Salsuginibacillus halophilus]|uniref:Glyoxylase-like metal-dependent hydrolase (Beta-lactamase superfamily II) n=1 Tax=Salsuginibacillus halophilus TaxID=517424 RepID=A0A2P8HWF4_9BACI|nr:MBL fold metallo-hydrolase [Salsuginibacillus halophilus]PSL50563.1 glyoxylase-like metal-dependent hydrolase (beta-lactamase superfamily II) [Salsuginibacillus halophilus]
METNVYELDKQTHLIDGFDMKVPGRTGTYVLSGGDLTLIETGPSLSIPYVKQGLEEIGYQLEDIRYIILTHVHLDHAGGAGLLLQDCPNAVVLAHDKAIKHLNDPSRLTAGARAVYRDWFEELFAPVIPIPEQRLQPVKDMESLELGGRKLTFYNSPGHAYHHISIYDNLTNGIFTGDTAGIRYPALEHYGVELYLPSTSPNQFDEEAMRTSMKRLFSLKPSTVFFGHFGESREPEEVFAAVNDRLSRFVAFAEETAKNGGTNEHLAATLENDLQKSQALQTVPDDHPIRKIIRLDLDISAMGLMHRLRQD